jgi:hypothetical protein
MKHAWFPAVLVILPMLAFAHGCGDADETNTQPSDGEAGGAPGEGGAPGGEAGTPSSSGGDAGAASSSGGEAGLSSSGGEAGEAASGGAPGNGGAFGSGGSGGPNVDGSAACLHPYGTYCTEFTGSEEGAIQFGSECSNLEMMSVQECPAADVSGVCLWTDGSGSLETFHYQLDADESEEAQSDCDALSGTWVVP